MIENNLISEEEGLLIEQQSDIELSASQKAMVLKAKTNENQSIQQIPRMKHSRSESAIFEELTNNPYSHKIRKKK